MPAKLPVEPNTRFGCLTVIKEDGKLSGKPAYLVQCDCGKQSRKNRAWLKDSRVACGNSCAVRPVTNYKHGAAEGDPANFPGAYRSWLGMRSRCYDTSQLAYPRYGGRGIKICDHWQEFQNFLADMGERPPGMSIDRYPDNDGNYEPGNCRWATPSQQRVNQRPRKKLMVALNFSTQGVAPNAALEPVPSGIYDVVITASTEEPTKAGNGSFIKFEFTVQQHQDRTLLGRKLYDRLNIRNPNQQAVDIAYGTLSAICHVTNRHNIQDTQQLHGIPLKIVVAKVARDDKPGEFSNEVKGYKDVNGNDPGAGGGQQPPNTGAGGQQFPDPAHSPQQGVQNQGGGQQYGNNQGGGNGPSFAQGNGQTQGPGAGQQNYGNNQGNQQQGQNNGQQGNQPPAWAGNGAQQGNGQNGGGQPQQNNQGQQVQQNNQQGNQGQNQGGGQPFTPGAAPPWAQNQGQ